MRNAGLEETEAGIKIAGRNINNLRYADDTTLMAESKELKSLLMKVKEESEKVSSEPQKSYRSEYDSTQSSRAVYTGECLILPSGGNHVVFLELRGF